MSTMERRQEYLKFLRRKIPQAEQAGFQPPTAPHDSLFPHQCDIALWAVTGGRRAIFAQFGLGKTRIHLQIALWVTQHTGGRYLIVAPLGVRQEFTQSDGPALGLQIEYVRTNEEVQASTARILITNYERVRDGDIDVSQFAGAGLDESSVLRSFGSKTYQNFLSLFKAVPYRYVLTATPSPNRYKELIHYAGFLGIMDTGEALTRFFQRDSEQANNLTLYPHMEHIFWAWMHSWACFATRPSDLGYPDEGYDLPKLHVHWHRLAVDQRAAWEQVDNFGQAQLLRDDAQGLKESAAVKRESIEMRVACARELIASKEGQKYSWPAPTTLEEHVIDRALALTAGHWHVDEIHRGVSGKSTMGSCGSSLPVMWQTAPKGLEIQDADKKAIIPWKRLEERARQYEPAKQKHWLIWHDLEDERREIERQMPLVTTVYGSQDLEEREAHIMGFSRGEYRILATKPVIAGSGCNFQRHCSDAIFLGVGYKFNDFIQAIHRIHRFQQKREVHIHIIHLDSEDAIVAELQAKWRRHDELMARMSAMLREHRLSTISLPIITT